jgi:hypothetical protein
MRKVTIAKSDSGSDINPSEVPNGDMEPNSVISPD